MVRLKGPDLHGLLAPQTKGPLQFEGHPHMGIAHFREPIRRQLLGFRDGGDRHPWRNPVAGIRRGEHGVFANFALPPPQNTEAIFHGPWGQALCLPQGQEPLDMAGLEVAHMHLRKTGCVELLAEKHEHMEAICPGGVTAFLMLLGELAEFIRELVHAGPPGHVGVSTLSRVRSVRES